MSAISPRRGTICGGECIAVWLERSRVPLRGQNSLQGFERVRVLKDLLLRGGWVAYAGTLHERKTPKRNVDEKEVDHDR